MRKSFTLSLRVMAMCLLAVTISLISAGCGEDNPTSSNSQLLYGMWLIDSSVAIIQNHTTIAENKESNLETYTIRQGGITKKGFFGDTLFSRNLTVNGAQMLFDSDGDDVVDTLTYMMQGNALRINFHSEQGDSTDPLSDYLVINSTEYCSRIQ